MIRKIATFLLYLLLVLSAGLFFVTAKYPSANLYVRELLGIAPCQRPLSYSIAQFDTKFGITKEDFLKAVAEAAAVWEKPISKDLFNYAPDGKLKINLTYDYRQQATDQLKSIGFKIDNTKESYNALKAEYRRQMDQYNADKSALDSMVKEFESRKQKYDSDVAYWNSHGGAPEEKYNSLKNERGDLQTLVDEINAAQTDLNKEG